MIPPCHGACLRVRVPSVPLIIRDVNCPARTEEVYVGLHQTYEGSHPVFTGRSTVPFLLLAPVVSTVEQLPYMQKRTGSSPVRSTINCRYSSVGRALT